MDFAANGCTVIFFMTTLRSSHATGLNLNEVEDFAGLNGTIQLQKQRLTKETASRFVE